MEIESISNKLSNIVENMRGHFNTSPTKREKSLPTRLFLTPFVTRFLGFYQQRYTLGGSLLPYRFRRKTPYSTTAIPWAEHLLLLR